MAFADNSIPQFCQSNRSDLNIETDYEKEADNSFSCGHCNHIFKSEKQFIRHQNYLKSYRGYDCPKNGCGQKFLCKSHLITHLNTHSGKRPFVCKFRGCQYRAGAISQLTQHSITHGVGYLYSCEHCDYKATTSSNLRRHCRLHFNIRPYACPHCPHTFFEISSLRRHVLDSAHHPGLPLYVCPWCNPPRTTSLLPVGNSPVGFNSSTLAWRHLLSVHADQLKSSETMQHIDREPGETLTARDVSLIFGLYRPHKDGKFKPSSEVRHSSSFFRGPQNSIFRSSSRLNEISSESNAKEDYSSHKTLLEHSLDLIDVDLNDSESRFDSKSSDLNFNEVQGIVMLPGGAIWSAVLLDAELSRFSVN